MVPARVQRLLVNHHKTAQLAGTAVRPVSAFNVLLEPRSAQIDAPHPLPAHQTHRLSARMVRARLLQVNAVSQLIVQQVLRIVVLMALAEMSSPIVPRPQPARTPLLFLALVVNVLPLWTNAHHRKSAMTTCALEASACQLLPSAQQLLLALAPTLDVWMALAARIARQRMRIF
jgi:hypothetical protein